MGNELFGVDIAGIINDEVGPGVLAATLTRRIEKGECEDDPTAPPKFHHKDYNCRGFTESFTLKELQATGVMSSDRKITLIGGSLPAGIVPIKGDTIKIEDSDFGDKTFQVLEMLERDPAAATYQVHARL